MSLLLGVDGGNTKTVALVAALDGTVLGCGRGGRADIHNADSVDAALGEIASAVALALEAAGARPSDLAAAAFGLAGADWPEDFALLREGLRARVGLAEEPDVVNDAIAALRSGTDGAGVSVVCGTYGAIAARNGAGEIFHLGFWPDGTGAYALGSEALSAVWRWGLGLGPATSLAERALERWACADTIELLHAFTRRGGLPALEPSRFAGEVLDEAEAGDDVAREIVRDVAGRLGLYARVCAERTGQLGSPFALVLSGGVLRHPSALLREAILAPVPDAVSLYPELDPVAGALLVAADRAGATPDPERLRTSSRAALDAGEEPAAVGEAR